MANIHPFLQSPQQQPLHQVNDYETEFLYNEIFERHTYKALFANISPASNIFDIGANIGLFCLYAKQLLPNSKIHCFEPAPSAFSALQKNMANYNGSIIINNCAVSNQDGNKQFGYYPDYSVISGFKTNLARDLDIITQGLISSTHSDYAEAYATVSKRLGTFKTIEVNCLSISTYIEQHAINLIDILKIDAEGEELEILHGVSEQHWPYIKKLFLEIHSAKDLHEIKSLLENKNYMVETSEDSYLGNAEIYNLLAIKNNP